MTVKRMDNVGIVVADLDAAIEFFLELGLSARLGANRLAIGHPARHTERPYTFR
jgi:hypothetical protein